MVKSKKVREKSRTSSQSFLLSLMSCIFKMKRLACERKRTMSIDKSLRRKNQLARARNVLTRAERVLKLMADERWPQGRSPFGLPKVKVVKLVVKKAKKAKEEEKPAEGGAAAAAPGAAPAPAAAEKKPAEKKAAGGDKKK
jgi:small basic protein (TIGR04137 family)